MTAQIIAVIVFVILAAFFVQLIVKKGRGALLASLCLFSILYFFLYKSISILLYLALLNLQLTLVILSLEDISKQYLLAWHFIFLLLSVMLVRIFLDIPLLLNILAVVMAFTLFFIPHMLTKGKGLGIGDVIVFPILAILFTPVEIMILFLLTLLSGTLFAVVQKMIIKENRTFPLVPFMHLALFLYFPLKDMWLRLLHLNNLYLFQFI